MIDRARSEQGIAVPLVLSVMVIVALFAAVGATTVIRALSDSNRDRASAQAFQLADSGVNLTIFHMNKHFTANEIQSLVDVGTGVVQTSACLSIEGDVVVADIVTSGGDGGFCTSVAFPGLNEGDQSTVCWTDLRLDLNDPLSLPGLIERRVICQGTVNGVSRRVGAEVAINIDTSTGEPTSLWDRTTWLECTSERPTGLDPAGGCGALETPVV